MCNDAIFVFLQKCSISSRSAKARFYALPFESQRTLVCIRNVSKSELISTHNAQNNLLLSALDLIAFSAFTTSLRTSLNVLGKILDAKTWR